MGQELVRSKGIAALTLTLALFGGCREEKKPATTKNAALRDAVDARVFVYAVKTAPNGQPQTSEVVAVDGKVRLTSELDRWRLFDLQQKAVYEVDEIARRFRKRTLTQLIAEKRAQQRQSTPPTIPPLRYEATGRTETIGGVAAREYVMEMGGFRRELWLAENGDASANFWPLYIASEPIGGAYPARLAGVHLALADVQTFPVADRVTLRYGTNGAMTMTRELVRIENRKVPRALVTLPRDFTDAATAPAAGRPAASSPRSGQSAPAAGSPPSARSQRTP